MAQPTTLEKARMLMKKLVNTKINRSPLPINQERTYPVASLSGGRMLLSNGGERQTPVLKNIEKMKEQQVFGGETDKDPLKYLSTLSLNIAIPAKQTGKNISEQTMAFAKYLRSVLQPTLAAPAETGLPSMFPELENKIASFQIPSALSDLPKLAPRVESVGEEKSLFDDFSKTAEKLQEALKKEFLGQISSGESETSNINRFANLPLVQGYGTQYRLPVANNAEYSRVSGNPFVLTHVVR